MNLIFIIAAIIVLITTSLGALFLSHKVAGPLHRLKIHLSQIVIENKLRPVKFRKGDFFIELEEFFNIFIESLKNKNFSEKNKDALAEDEKRE
jgi:nitrogen fixation/metabolism regulation signal transduction histidine kinase